MKDNNFKFWVPLTIRKAKDKDGKEVMKVGGIASTYDEDSDGEFLDPKGFDLKPLMSTGVINWHHQTKTNPEAIIGEPTKAEIKKQGLYLESELYADSELAKKVYKLAEVLQANSSTRRLGFSIEGKALEKDKSNPKIIKRASITGCAITYMPKNPSTFVDIIKGNVDYEEVEEVKVEDSSLTTESNGGDSQELLLDMLTKEGGSVKIKKNGEIIIDLSKSISTEPGSGGALKKEHVDDGTKDVVATTKMKELTKAEVFDRIFSDFSDIEISKAKQIHNIILKITQMKNKTKPTEDEIKKAYAILGIKNDDILKGGDDDKDDDDKEKGDDTEDKDDDKEKGKMKKGKLTVKKGDDDKDEDDKEKGDDTEEEDKEKGKVKKGDDDKDDDDKEKGKVKKADDDKDEDDKEKGDDTDDKEKGKVKKGATCTYMKKANGNYAKMIIKGSEAEEEKDTEYEKGGDGSFKAISKAKIEKALMLESLDEIKKANGTLFSDVLGKLGDIADRLTVIESGTSGRKSMDKVKAKEKEFQKGNNVTEEGNDVAGISVSKNRRLILEILEKAAFAPIKKGGAMDEDFEKAISVYEVSRTVTPLVRKRLKDEFDIELTA